MKTKKIIENYESVIIEASKLSNQLKRVIKGHQQMLGTNQRRNKREAAAEESENRRKAEVEGQEKGRQAELKREKLRVNEKLQLEKVNLERLKIETDANLQKEKLESEVRLRAAETKKRDKNLETYVSTQSRRVKGTESLHRIKENQRKVTEDRT